MATEGWTPRVNTCDETMQPIAYVNGVFCGMEEAKVSIEDRGFQFADGVYEVIAARGRQPFRLQQHLERLQRSADAIGLAVDLDSLTLPKVIDEGIARCGYEDVMVYVQLTRGVAPRKLECFAATRPTVVATFRALPVFSHELRQRGVALRSVRDTRWAYCSVKSVSLLANVLLKRKTQQDGFFDALIIGPDDLVREATSANVFAVVNGILRTPPLSEHILHGVTRDYVLECAKDVGIESREEEMLLRDVIAAEEVFLCSTTKDIVPVSSIDGQTIASGLPGPVTRELLQLFPSSRGR